MKDRQSGNWWPMNHWSEPMIKVHAFYCTIAVLLRGLLLQRVRAGGLQISSRRLLAELDGHLRSDKRLSAAPGQKAPSSRKRS